MRLRLWVVSMLVIGLLALSLRAVPSFAQESPYRIVGYYPAWAIYDRQYFVTDVRADMLTQLIYAVATLSEDGLITFYDQWADVEFPYPGDDGSGPFQGNFRQLQLLKQANPHLQTLLSIGGWIGSAYFSDAALTDESRAAFARSVVEFILRYGFDGVDIDWEFPTGGGAEGNIERPEDVDNYVLLLKELRSQLDAQARQDGRPYLLTIAVASGSDAYGPLDWDRIVPLIDWLNVMTYEMSGGWSDVTGFESPLYDSSANPPEGGSADRSVRGLLAEGVPPQKVVVGVPFYARGWQGVPPANNGLHQPFSELAPGTWEAGDYDYRDLADNYIGVYPRFWDATAQVPWLYDPASGIMISYEDPESVALKAAYVRENGLGGIMIWELSSDEHASLLAAIYETLYGSVGRRTRG